MKKILCALLALMMLFAVSALSEDEERIVLYASVPEDWTYPCVWAWNQEGVNAFAAWPGEMMEPDPNNAGWYYIYLPAGMEMAIVNANDGSVQTDAVAIDKKNAWITVNADKTAVAAFDKLTEGDAPEYTERFTVYAKVDAGWENPGVWAWEDPSGKNAFAPWPGRQMKANENGWYSCMVPAWCNSVIINANGGAVQTADIKDLDPADLWITVNADATFDVTYDDPTAPKAADITVYATVPADWAEPCLWAWSHPDGTNAFVSWPGEAFEKGEDGVYKIVVPGWINSVIVNANGGTVQTADLRVEAGKDLYITVVSAEEAAVAYEGAN